MPFDFDTFKGEAKALDALDIPRLAHRIGAGEDELHAFCEVEAAGSGFDTAGRPKMLFEPHVFYRNLTGAKRDEAVAKGLAYRRWGEQPYPRDSYPRIKEAMKIDRTAALLSASWGRGQILGENFSTAGYSSVEQMVNAFMQDEEEHVEAMVKFILANGIDDDIRAHRWETVARVYNGAGYKTHGYHTKLAAAFRKWQGRADQTWAPDVPDSAGPGIENGEQLKQVQERLRTLGYFEVGMPDGKWGTKSRAAVLAFRADNGLPIYAGVDADMLAILMIAPTREVGETRRDATVQDLREQGSRTIRDADQAREAGKVVTGVGAVLGVTEVVDQLSENVGVLTGLAEQIKPLQQFVTENIWLVLVGVGVFIVWKSGLIQKWRLIDHQEGKNAGPGR